MGCTEPIAIALAAAKAREALGEFPEDIVVACSGNVIKNAKAVDIPGSGGLRGIEASAILGAVAGNADLLLEVLTPATPGDAQRARALLGEGICRVEIIPNTADLHIIVTMKSREHRSLVEISETHTNIIHVEKDGVPLETSVNIGKASEDGGSREFLNLADIYQFANTVEISDIAELIDRQIAYNTRIAEAGITDNYGASVGKSLLRRGGDIYLVARAYAAAGSDARMNGCMLPVVTNSGSGNQGITVSLPVIKYAEHLKVSKDELYRALVMSNLIAIYQKVGIGRLSAYCGAVSAACGAAAGIAYLMEVGLEVIGLTVVNTLANISGMVCDGAKASCAAKISTAVEAALMALDLALTGKGFSHGEGIVGSTPDRTVANIGRLASRGMRETDLEILKIMTEPEAVYTR